MSNQSARCLFGFICVWSVALTAQPLQEFSLFADKERNRLNIPGVAIAIIDQGEVRHVNLGVRLSGHPGKITSTTRFQVASISKPVTAWALMRLAEQKIISLDEPVSRYLKGWNLPPSDFTSESVTLRRIMSHAAGLSGRSYQGFSSDLNLPSIEESLNGIPLESSQVKLVAQPGVAYRYSGGGYTVAQLIIENVTGLPFRKYMHDELFEPLRMREANYHDPSRVDELNSAKPHGFTGNPLSIYLLAELAAGGLRASAADMVQFVMANMNLNAVLTLDAISELHKPLIDIGPSLRSSAGFEWRDGLLSHGGQNRGWLSWIDISPADQSGLVILTNAESGVNFIDPVRCKWNELFQIQKLTAYCQKLERDRNYLRWMLLSASAVILALAMYVVLRKLHDYRAGRSVLSLNLARVLTAFCCLTSTILLWTLLATDLGVYLFVGIRWGFPTINYLPPEAWHLAGSLTVLGLASVGAVVQTRIH